MDFNLEVCNSEDFYVNGGIWSIRLPKLCRLIIDTPIFQRLRRICQNGITELVYPDATHSRFVHSLSTASLAYDFMNTLKQKYPSQITKKDILCVTIAALVHDVGHGAFSHLFEDVFEGGICHEDISCKLFMKIINDYPHVRKGLLPLDDLDFKLIQQLIHPPPFENVESNGKEWPLVVPREKAFLFAVVSNPLNGLDVDKFEYMIRDASHCGVQIGFNKDTVSLLISSVQLCKHLDYNFLWVAYSHKHYLDVLKIFESRKDLHQNVYNHRFLLPSSEMIKKALQLAGPYLIFKGANGNMVPLNQCSTDLDAYLKLDDSIYTFILNSPLPEMEKAQKVLEQLESRLVPKLISKFDEVSLNDRAKSLKLDIEKLLKKQSYASFDSKEIFATTKSFNGGKGDCDPLQYVFFYPRADSTQTCIFKDDSIQAKHCIFVYAPYEASEEDAKIIYELLKKFSTENETAEPKYMFKGKLEM